MQNIMQEDNNSLSTIILNNLHQKLRPNLTILHNAIGLDYNEETGTEKLLKKSRNNNINETNIQKIITELHITNTIELPKAPSKRQYEPIIFDAIKFGELLCKEALKGLDPSTDKEIRKALSNLNITKFYGLVLEPFIINLPFKLVLPKLDKRQQIILALFIEPAFLQTLTPEIAEAIPLSEVPMNDSMLKQFLRGSIDMSSLRSLHTTNIEFILDLFIGSLSINHLEIYLQNKSIIDPICQTTSKKTSISLKELEKILHFAIEDFPASQRVQKLTDDKIVMSTVAYLEGDEKALIRKPTEAELKGGEFMLIIRALELAGRSHDPYQIKCISHCYIFFHTTPTSKFDLEMRDLFIRNANNPDRRKRTNNTVKDNRANFDFSFVNYLAKEGILPKDYFNRPDFDLYHPPHRQEFITCMKPLLPEISLMKDLKIKMQPKVNLVYDLIIVKLRQKLKLIKNGQSHYETTRPIIFLKKALDLLEKDPDRLLYTDNSKVIDNIVRLLHNLDFLDNNWLKIITKEKQAMIETGVTQQDLP